MRLLSTLAVMALLAACSPAEDPPRADGSGGDGVTANASRASAQSSGGSGGSSGAGGAAVCAPFPEGPIGVEEGDVLAPDVVVHGLLEGSDVESAVALGDLRDCDGRTGVDAVLLIVARTSCATCRTEAETLAEEAATWAAAGVRTVVLLTSGDAAAWQSTYDLDGVAVLADPWGTLDLPEPPHEPTGGFQPTPNGTPLYVVLDPRTGLIHQRHLGSSWVDDELLALAARNAATR